MLVDVAGKDASEEFDNAGHSDDASEIMAAYCIGKLLSGSKNTYTTAVRLSVGVTARKHNSTRFGAAVAIALGTAGLYHVVIQQASFTALLSRTLLKKISRFGFLEGFLVASTAFCVAGVVLSRRLVNLLQYHPTPLDHPPHQVLKTCEGR